jgi:hypothetical protein
VTGTLTLQLARFEREALEAYGSTQRVPADRVVGTAVLYYLRHREGERTAWRISAPAAAHHERGEGLDVEIGEDVAQALADEAAAQRVSPESLARHALLFFLADVDSGRVAAELSRALRDH